MDVLLWIVIGVLSVCYITLAILMLNIEKVQKKENRMKKYTIRDIKKFKRNKYGRLICPTGDYTQIRHFEELCSFGKNCSFNEECSFGEGCLFDVYCSFGKDCSFGEHCSFRKSSLFGERCSFGKMCFFEDSCSFGEHCSFGKSCYFEEHCSFGKNCSFSEGCNLDNNLKFENIDDEISNVLKIDRIGSRKGCAYFFKTLNEIYVRCGCFFGTITEFENAVNETHKNNEQFKKEYLEAIKFIKKII